MKTMSVCIGSACHVKGSYEVIEALKQLIQQHQLQEEVAITGAFCLGHCVEAVSVRRWDGKILSISPENVTRIFLDEIVACL